MFSLSGGLKVSFCALPIYQFFHFLFRASPKIHVSLKVDFQQRLKRYLNVVLTQKGKNTYDLLEIKFGSEIIN